MATLLDAIGYYLPQQLPVSTYGTKGLVLGQNLFLGRLPAEAPNAAVLVQQYQGEAPDFTMGAAVFALENPRIQIQVRGEREDYPGAYDWTTLIQNVLGAIVGTQIIDGVTILRMQPLGSPNPLQYDDADRPRFTINFQVTQQP
jgi:Bacteriophage minor capsid protein